MFHPELLIALPMTSRKKEKLAGEINVFVQQYKRRAQ